MINIIQAKPSDAFTIHTLAHAIWYPTYQNVLAKDQIDFMLAKMYSEESIQSAMTDNSLFYIMQEESNPIGFIAVKEIQEVLRIDKLYLLPNTQGKGLGSQLLEFAGQLALDKGIDILELNVNRYNKAYHFYLKQGFEVVETVDIPYYQYFLNDYVMQKRLIP